MLVAAIAKAILTAVRFPKWWIVVKVAFREVFRVSTSGLAASATRLLPAKSLWSGSKLSNFGEPKGGRMQHVKVVIASLVIEVN